MKKILLFICASLLAACTADSTENVSKVTNYPVLTLLGEEEYIIPKGQSFTDPGITATEGGNEIEYVTTVRGFLLGGRTLDVNVPDEYTITYTATNVDGFSLSTTRKVIVVQTGNLVNDISGLYLATVSRDGASGPQYTQREYVFIVPNGENTYKISDGIGGYYDLGRAYGPAYRAPATIIANNIATDNFTIPDFTVGSFGGTVTMETFAVNDATRTIDFTNYWDSGYNFVVHLDQIQL
jgi:hypothetical protein